MLKKIIIAILLLIPFTYGATNLTLWTLNQTAGNMTNMTIEAEFAHLGINTNLYPYSALRAYWNFDYNLRDYTTNNFDMTASGADIPPFVSDMCAWDDGGSSDCTNRECHDWSGFGYAMPLYNKALFFSQCITADNAVSFNTIADNDLSVCLWYYLDSTYIDSPVTNHPSSGDVLNWKIDRVAFDSNPASWFICPVYAPSTNNWRHVCITTNTTTDTAKIYENGVNKCELSCATYDTDAANCEARGCEYTAYSCVGDGICGIWDTDETACVEHDLYCDWTPSVCTGTTANCAALDIEQCFNKFASHGCSWSGSACEGGNDCSTFGETDCLDENFWGGNCNYQYSSCTGSWSCPELPEVDCATAAAYPYFCEYIAQSCEISSTLSVSTIGYGEFTDFYKGAMDEVMIFATELSPSNIGNIYNRTSNRFKKNGTIKWNQNLGTSDLINFTLPYWNTTQLSNLSVKVNNGSEQYFSSSGTVLNYNLSNIGLKTNATITLQFRAGNGTFDFYTPIVANRMLSSYWSNAVSSTCSCPILGDWVINDGSYCRLSSICKLVNGHLYVGKGTLYIDTANGGTLK